MPTVAAALRAGRIDRNRVLVLLDVCTGLSDEHRDTIIAEVLPGAGSVPPAKLRAHAQRLAIALDPEWAERRYRLSLREQRVVCYIADDGTVTLSGQNLDADQAHAAKAHVWELARAAKRAGAHASSDKLRATLFTALLNQHYLGLGRQEIIAELVKQFPKPVPDQPAEEPTQPEPARPAADPKPAPAAKPQPHPTMAPGVELRVGFATLMGLCDHPGEIAGAGPVIAAVARDIACAQRRGEWRFAIVDEHGRLLFDGITRHRPTNSPTGYPAGGARGGIVELHVPTYLLDPAFIDEHPQWAPLLTDLAQQYATQKPIAQNPTARAPGQPLRRRVQIRHRYCLFPSCRRPAGQTQTDHRHDYAHGGVTLEKNLGPLCEAHHDLKTRWGWRLIKQDDQTYLWISPYGRKHLVTIEPVAPPLPDPPDWPDTSAA